ncbi:DNA-processing protein DprA [Paucibacter sp. XJ19-41]|uniref:DNA-processing protein DprA n=1 Tax=Paucibacter sp. XJ19-41 TaxID=2927824 RepID=UPI00234905AB|nr:DNA-processing protein DprA [Paucibacter sp. XJ19-41]MDC6169864.1 DNA-processing protein DprA [Paucibacter sp. XJ19-41]
MERSELAAWLQLLETPGLGLESARRLLAGLGSPQAVIGATALTRRQFVAAGPAQALGEPSAELLGLIDRTWAWLQGGARRDVLVLGDADYPPALLQTADPPLLLYLIGRRELLAAESLAIVGSRRPTPQGRDNAHDLALALGQAGLTVVSGLALGIDGAAHAGALKSPAATIAVLGTGLDQIYPSSHQRLADEIAERGLLLSEYSLGTPPLPANFPRRNRIIAGLARGCLVVEAAPRSGSLITARLAAEAGREVFAVPGSIHAPQSKGCHELLRQGAKLVERAEDVLEELRPSRATPPVRGSLRDERPADPPEPDGETGLLLAAMGYEPVSLDALQARGGWSAAQLNALLLELELSGAVARLPGQLFQRQSQA